MCVLVLLLFFIRDWVYPAVLRLLLASDLSLWNKSCGAVYLAGEQGETACGTTAVHSTQENKEISNWNVEFNCQLCRLQQWWGRQSHLRNLSLECMFTESDWRITTGTLVSHVKTACISCGEKSGRTWSTLMLTLFPVHYSSQQQVGVRETARLCPWVIKHGANPD